MTNIDNKQKKPEVTVSAIIQNPEGDVLLCRSAKWNNQYVIPGGHVEYGETMEAAIIREVKEETGLDISVLQLLSLQESIEGAGFMEPSHMIFVDFLCRTVSQEVVLNDEADAYVWAPKNRILSYDLGGFLQQLFTEWLKDKSTHSHSVLYGYV